MEEYLAWEQFQFAQPYQLIVAVECIIEISVILVVDAGSLRVRLTGSTVSSVPGGAYECPTTTPTGASSGRAPPYPIHITPLGTSLL